MLRSELSSHLRTNESVRPMIGRADSPLLHVMSYNLRNASDTNPDPWPPRRPVTAAVLEAERPTVIGTQEGFYQQIREVADDLPTGYEWVGAGREGGSRGEFMAIFFDSYRLQPREYDHFWLSDTPSVVGSATWGNTCVRMATWVRFEDLVTGKEFVVLNTHLDHAVERAQNKGADLLRESIAAFDASLPVILTGDFNVPAERSQPYTTLAGDGELLDTWLVAEQRVSDLYATYNGYRPPTPDGDRIDWILTRPGIRTRVAGINTTTIEGEYGSDHWPVQALIELP
ncbi:endonuclease/exonuclease/phosphatase family protein [Flindersiella endophytica]